MPQDPSSGTTHHAPNLTSLTLDTENLLTLCEGHGYLCGLCCPPLSVMLPLMFQSHCSVDTQSWSNWFVRRLENAKLLFSINRTLATTMMLCRVNDLTEISSSYHNYVGLLRFTPINEAGGILLKLARASDGVRRGLEMRLPSMSLTRLAQCLQLLHTSGTAAWLTC